MTNRRGQQMGLLRVVEPLAYASSAVSVVGILFLVAFFSSGGSSGDLRLGMLNDIAVIIQYVLMVPIAVVLHRMVRTSGPRTSVVALGMGLGGMVAVVALQMLLVTGLLAFERQIGLVIAAFMVVLAWFVLVYRLGRSTGVLPASMALHVLAGLYVGYPFWAFAFARRLRRRRLLES